MYYQVGEDLRGRVCLFWEDILAGFLPKQVLDLVDY
jgi:hypothetical protein